MPIRFHKNAKEFHLYNNSISYIIKILENGQPGQVYFGRRLTDREEFGYLVVSEKRRELPDTGNGTGAFCKWNEWNESDITYAVPHQTGQRRLERQSPADSDQ